MSTPSNIAANVRARFNHHQARCYLTEKYKNQLTIVSQGGTWTITPELLACLKTLQEVIILEDDNGRPTKVNVSELYVEALETYNNIMNAWYEEFSEVENTR